MTFPVIAQKSLLLACLDQTPDADEKQKENEPYALPVMNFSLQPLRASFIAREPIRPFLGTIPQIASAPYAEMSFDLMLPTMIDGEDILPWKELLIACGFAAEKQANATDHKYYSTENIPTPALNFFYYAGGEKFSVTGARGNFVLLIEAGQIPLLRFRFIGEHAKITSETMVAHSYNKWERLLPVSPQNTLFEIGTLANLGIRRFSVNLGNSLRLVKRTNKNSIIIEGRKPTGSMLFDFTAKNTFDPFHQAFTQEMLNLRITHGDKNNHHWRFEAPFVQLLETAIERDNGLSVFRSELAFHQNASSATPLPEMRFYAQ